MLIVLSPAKALNYTADLAVTDYTQARLLDESSALIEVLRPLSPHQVADLMELSDSLATLNVTRYAQWSRPFTPENARQAVFAFDGDVYEGLSAREMDRASALWMQDHVRILSGLYGVLRPLDLMQAYRLEMGTKLENPRGKNLYAFWGGIIASLLRADLDASGGAPVLVNLASEEYFKSLDLSVLNAPVITPVFQEYRNGAWKVVSFSAKRARGLMTRYSVEQRIDRPEGLKGFDWDGYQFDASASTDDQWCFRRETA